MPLSLFIKSPPVFSYSNPGSSLYSISSELSLPYKILATSFFNNISPHWSPLCTPLYLDVCVWSDELFQALDGTHKEWAVGGENLEEGEHRGINRQCPVPWKTGENKQKGEGMSQLK